MKTKDEVYGCGEGGLEGSEGSVSEEDTDDIIPFFLLGKARKVLPRI